MVPRPASSPFVYRSSARLRDRVALITGGDSGIGRAVAVQYAREGADVAIVYLDEHEDAEETVRLVEEAGRSCVAIAGDVGDPERCRAAVGQVIDSFGRLDVLVNNAAEMHVEPNLEDITVEQLERTFRTNVFGFFYMVQAALPHLAAGSSVINTTSVTAYRGSPALLSYSSSKGAIVAFTRSLARALLDRGIRVNAVAPGPIWTPLIAAGLPADKVASFGADAPMKRAGQPHEVAPAFVYLASEDSSYMTGQVLHPNGGEIVGT